MKVGWRIIAILFLAWMMSYFERAMISTALPFIGHDFGLTATVMGFVSSAFFIGYALMQIPGGIIADRFGSRKTIAIGILVWSVFSALTGTAGGLATLIWIRILFGLGEGVFPPGSWKMLSNWFKPATRATANAVMLCSNLVGPALAPLVFAPLMGAVGWRHSFWILAIPGLAVAVLAWWYLRDRPRDHPKITPAEIEELASEEDSRPVTDGGLRASLKQMLRTGVLWKLFFIWMTWDVTWWGFLSWLPTYLYSARGLTLTKTGLMTALPYVVGLAGMLLAGYLADKLKSRKAVMIPVLIGNAVFMTMMAFATSATSVVIALIGIGFFLPAMYGPFWSLPMDLLPSKVMGYAAGFINFGGQIAGFTAPIVIGALVQGSGHYVAGFVFMAVSAVVSLVLTVSLKEKRKMETAVAVA